MSTNDTREHRKFVYGFCREALKRSATPDQVSYALELVSSISGHKALGFRTRLQMKLDGHSIKWKDI
jgi:hypothetical protein